ncbi:MAG: hypothetical protein ACLTDM_07035 [Clostridium butyricum]
MPKFEIIQYLTSEVEKEIELLQSFKQTQRLYYKAKETDDNYDTLRNKYYNMKVPSKNKIKEYLKMVRRLSLEIEKEIGDL